MTREFSTESEGMALIEAEELEILLSSKSARFKVKEIQQKLKIKLQVK